MTPEAGAALVETEGRLRSALEGVTMQTSEGVIRRGWSLYLMMLITAWKDRQGEANRRKHVRWLARQIGHKLTADDARTAFSVAGEVDGSALEVIGRDLDQMQKTRPRMSSYDRLMARIEESKKKRRRERDRERRRKPTR
jgi:hypothetical protein